MIIAKVPKQCKCPVCGRDVPEGEHALFNVSKKKKDAWMCKECVLNAQKYIIDAWEKVGQIFSKMSRTFIQAAVPIIKAMEALEKEGINE